MFSLADSSYENKWATITKLELNNELKSILIKCMEEKDFQIRSFTNSYNYQFYWIVLENYMIKHYNCKPEKPDKFVFLLLLTYPKKYILQLNSFLQLKIAFNELIYHGSSENSDFTCIGYKYSADNNCICSQNIENVFEFQNNLSGVVFNVGSVCNNIRHKVVSENDENYTLMKKAERDRKEEKKNGWPEGYKEQQRLSKKKMITSTNKTNSPKNKKKVSSVKDYSYITNNICYRCESSKIFSQSSKGTYGICSCVFTEFKIKQKKVMNEILHKIKIINCSRCNLETIKKNNDLCSECNKEYKSINCLKCSTKFCTSKNSVDLFCNPCIKTIKKCIDCQSYIMFNESYKTRCLDCYKQNKQKEKEKENENENIIDKVCENCNTDFKVSQEQPWKKLCVNCYKKTITNCECTTCERCDLSVEIFKVKKDGPNKGKNYYKCSKCSLFKWM